LEPLRLSLESLLGIYDDLPIDWHPRVTTASAKAYRFALLVIGIFVGVDWLNLHILNENVPSSFFRKDPSDPITLDIHMRRVVELGEMIFNFQNVPGFEACIQQLRDSQIEPTVAEMEVAKLLRFAAARFRFVTPAKKLGSDYDLEVLLPHDEVIAADTKCKIQSTTLSKTSLRNSLDRARKQLPPDRPGLIFVKVPPNWILSPGARRSLGHSVRAFFRSTKRVVSIKVYCAFMGATEEALLTIYRAEEYFNHASPFSTPANREKLLAGHRISFGIGHWLHFDTLAQFSEIPNPF
jgi:hypothetical protein